MSSKEGQSKLVVAAVALLVGAAGIVSLAGWYGNTASETDKFSMGIVYGDASGQLIDDIFGLWDEIGEIDLIGGDGGAADGSDDSDETNAGSDDSAAGAGDAGESEDAGDGEDDEGADEVSRLDELQAEIDQLSRAITDAENRLRKAKKQAASLEEVSGFSIDEYRPANGAKLAGKVIEFRGRTRYTMSFKIKQTGKTSSSSYGSIINVGDSSGKTRSPGLWVYPNSRRLHIRQALENSDGDYSHSSTWNRGCDPSTADTPAIGTQYKVEIIADSKFFTVKFNGEEVCRKAADVLPPPGQQTVWIGRPGTPAPAVIKNMKFEIL